MIQRRRRALAFDLARLAWLAALREADSLLAEAYAATRASTGERRLFGACDLGACEPALLARVFAD
ncbi:MAG: hypothetical protein ACLQIQ_17465 [Beijerinckiaceae bacterium]